VSRIVVVGVGAIGGVIAASLSRAGHQVTCVTGNVAIAEALAGRGFEVGEVGGETWRTPVTAPPQVCAGGGPFVVCIVTTKATMLERSLREVAPHLAPGAPVVVCQNGLPESIAAGVVGEDRVLGCIVVWGASMLGPGQVERTSRGSFRLGALAGERGPDPQPVARLLEAVAPVELEPRLLAARWSKLAINCATSTLGAIGGERLGVLLRKRFVRRLVLELWTEIIEVASKSGVDPAPVGGVNLARLTLTPRERRLHKQSPLLAGKHAIIMAVGMKYRRLRSSMLLALERGRTPEIDYLNGEIVRRGALLGVATPVNARLCAAIGNIVAGREKSGLPHLRRIYEEVMA
jgi:2-dehydropantoate 2-reductase